MAKKQRSKALYEGKAKILYPGPRKHTLIQYFKDDATAFNAQKKGTIREKGILNNAISAHIMQLLATRGIPTHFIERLSDREQLIKAVRIIPLEIVIRNRAAGSMSKRLGIKEGTRLPRPLLEFCLKNDALGDPLISSDHALVMGLASEDELTVIEGMSFKINEFLSGFFAGLGLELIDFKLEFGRPESREEPPVILADEISPDSCRLWDMKSGEKMDKDRFRHDLGRVEEAYQEVARRLGVLPVSGDPTRPKKLKKT